MKSNEYLLDRLAADLRLAGKAERTVEAYTGAVRRFMKVSGTTCLAEVCEDDLRSCLLGLAKRFRERVEIAFRQAGLYERVPRSVWCKPWAANVKRVGAGDGALLYLSRYVFRIAISNDRIHSFDGERFRASTHWGPASAPRSCAAGRVRSGRNSDLDDR